MDLPPTLKTVYQAVYSLFNNPNTSEMRERQQNADEMLHEKLDLETYHFAIQTLRQEIQQSFHELPAKAHTSLRDSLVEHISQINEQTDTTIVTQLYLALGDLALQMSSWQTPVIDWINKFSGNSTSLLPFLEVRTVLLENIKSRFLRLGANHRQDVLMNLNASASTVTEFLARILQCFISWVMVNAISVEVIPTSTIMAFAFQVLDKHMSVSQLHKAATDCVSMILYGLSNLD